MKFKVGQKVEDKWYHELGKGTIKEVLKTRIKILFPRIKHPNIPSFFPKNNIITYDRAHFQFLRITD